MTFYPGGDKNILFFSQKNFASTVWLTGCEVTLTCLQRTMRLMYRGGVEKAVKGCTWAFSHLPRCFVVGLLMATMGINILLKSSVFPQVYG